MATITSMAMGYDSSSVSMLFSGLGSSSNRSSMSSDLLGINYGDYATIRNGSYFKLVNAYYGGNSSDAVKKIASSSTSISKDDSKTITAVQDGAKNLQDSAEALRKTGKDSVFAEVTKKDEDGKETTGYDTDAIYKAVKSFVDDYNKVMDSASESNTGNIQRAGRTMANYSKVNEHMLEKIGITIDSDNKLAIDEDKFKKADMNTVKSLFGQRGSYGYQVQTQASLMETYAKSEAAKANTYGKTGSYTYNYNTGALYNSWF